MQLNNYSIFLTKKITAKYTFFDFVQFIRNKEFLNYRELTLSIESGGLLVPLQRKKIIHLNSSFLTAFSDLSLQKINAMQFLNRMSFIQQSALADMTLPANCLDVKKDSTAAAKETKESNESRTLDADRTENISHAIAIEIAKYFFYYHCL